MNTVVTTELHPISCHHCAVIYGLSQDFVTRAKQDGREWHCPHCEASTAFVKSEADKLRKQLASKEAALQRTIANNDRIRTELRLTERRRRAEKGAKTRVKNRIANGVCPCCDQHFSNLHEHMQKLHPDFVQTVDHDEKAGTQ